MDIVMILLLLAVLCLQVYSILKNRNTLHDTHSGVGLSQKDESQKTYKPYTKTEKIKEFAVLSKKEWNEKVERPRAKADEF